jgi:predicted unusual protein kinase regulating ubiquinone biosynthesis (AarF/ABC1/UbiB family)
MTTAPKSLPEQTAFLTAVHDTTYSPERVENQFHLSTLFKPGKNGTKGGAFVKRFAIITGFLTQFLLYKWWDDQVWSYIGEPDIERAQSQRRRQHARWLCHRLLVLGPTFIKVGQQISSRVDLVRKEIIDELAKLQDQVPPFNVDVARAIIETELGAPPETLFATFNNQHLAAASLGQVHRATLFDGTEVIVKIQRPDLLQTFELDLAIMRKLARYAERLLEFGQNRDWVGLVDEFGRTLFSEVDYIQEGRNADTFRKQFLNSPLRQRVFFPSIIWPMTGKRVITMDYAPGMKVNDVVALNRKGLDLPDLAQTIIKIFFEQILVHGFYHADPHPGNIAIRDDGTVIIYDFGMVGVIPEKSRKTVVDTFLNIVAKRPDALLTNILDLDMVSSNADLEVMRELLVWVLDHYYDVPHDQLNFEKITDDLAEVMYEHPFKLPPNITFMIRALITLEGVATTLHPQIKLMTSAVDYAQDFMGKTIDLPYLVRKSKELLGFSDPSNQPPIGRVRLQADEWISLSRYVKAGFICLVAGQGLAMGMGFVVVLAQPMVQLALPVWVWVLMGLLGLGYFILAMAVVVLLPSRKHRNAFKPIKTSSE